MTPALVLDGLAALTIDRTPLRDVAEASGSALQWSVVARHGARHHAIRVAAPARLHWRVYASSTSRIRVWCVEARCDTAEAHASITVEAASGWRELRLPLPPVCAGEISVALVADAPAGSGAAALWGDPMLERRRTAAEIAAAAMAAVRLLGPRRVLQRTAAAAGREEDTERYRHWLATRAPQTPAAAPSGPVVSVLTPVFNTDPVWLRRCIESVRRQTYPHWELILSDDGSTEPRTRAVLDAAAAEPRIRVVRSATNGGIVRASNAALGVASGELVAFLDHDDELAPTALADVIAHLDAHAGVDIVYTDEDKMDPSGARSDPHFKPDWSPELLLSCMYVSHLTVMRRQLVVEAGGFRAGFDGSQDYDLMLRVAELTDRIVHVPQVLYSWRTAPDSAASSQLAKPWAVRAGRRALEEAVQRRGLPALVTSAGAAGHFRVRYEIAGVPVISILMPSSPGGRATEVLHRTTRGRILDIVGADPSSAGQPLAARLNAMARRATGSHLLFLHDDVEPCGPGWLDAMVEFSQQARIGAVGPFLLRHDGTIDSAGLVLGVGGVAADALQGAGGWTRGHLSNALDVRNCSAVNGACLLTRRDVFERLGGFDERFGEALFAVDYGLRLREAGLRVVVTPHARVWHDARCRHLPAAGEADRLRARWGRALDRDPYYNAAFDRHAATFRLPPAPSAVD